MRYIVLFFTFFYFIGSQAVFAEKVSLRDKIGQMLIVGFDGKQVSKDSKIVREINEHNIGGVILFDYTYQTQQFDKNIESPNQARKLNTDIQNYTRLANHLHNRPPLPLIVSVDYEGGKFGTRLQERHGFPATFSATEVAKMPLKEAENAASILSQTLHNSAFNLNFAPVLDVNTNPDNPVIAKKERSFSSNPIDVGSYAAIYSQQFLQHGVQCVYKHFPGHGSSDNDSHEGFVDVTNTWQPMELYPYKFLFNQPMHCGMVMTAHIVNRQLDDSGLPATLSHKILTGLLRKQLSFNGVIVTDDMQMKAISDNYGLEKAVTLAINAGADMLVFGNQLTSTPQNTKEIIDIIEEKVNAGEISQARIDDAYRRIVTFKQSSQK